MKLKLTMVVLASIILSGCNLSIRKSAIEIMSNPAAKVYINGKEAGMTPYRNNTLRPGEIEIKLLANNQSWTKKIHLENGANTVISRDFGNDSATSGGYILFFESTGNRKKAGLLISSTPDRATVAIEDEVKGFSPIRLEDVGEGDKKLTVSFPGYKSAMSFVKFINGYQLVVEADLSSEEPVILPVTEPPAATPQTNPITEKTVTIKQTETGWLRVRSASGGGGAEVGRVNPGEKYKILEEKTEWIKIDLGNGKSGWISAKYADKS